MISTLQIQTKDLTVENFPIYSEFAWAQREYLSTVEAQHNAGKPIRVIVLKARQLGISTATEGLLFLWTFLYPGTNGLVVTHETEASLSLFEKTKMFWDTWPYKKLYKLESSTQKRLAWAETRSSLRIASAKNVQSGRGRTIHALHASECAFYPDPETLMTGLQQTIPDKPGTIMVLESTANGVGNWFHRAWEQAEAGESDFTPLFFPWWKHYEYQRHTSISTNLELTPEERQLKRLGASYEGIQWRRWIIPNKLNGDELMFMQEYPATPEEAFITSGQNVFPLRKLDECYEPEHGFQGYLVDNGKNIKFVSDSTGPLTIFRKPIPDNRSDRYFIAGDPSMTLQGDPACIQVINRATNEQVAVWHGRIDPINFATEMILVGKYFNMATLCPENEGGGQSTIAALIERSYPNIWQNRWADKAPGKIATSYGWATNYQRKNWAIGKLKYLIGDNSIVIHDKLTYKQLRYYTVLANGEMGNSGHGKDDHDDSVMALAIGVTASGTDGPFAEDTTGWTNHEVKKLADEYFSELKDNIYEEDIA